MKTLLTLVLFLGSPWMTSSQTKQEVDAKQTIIDFFEAFHNQDSVKLKSMVTKEIVMQSISKNADGETVLSNTEFDNFVTSIANIPKDNTFREILLDFIIKVDGDMANVWTPYEFWFNGKFSHCGVNSFQLMRQSEGWKIIYLIDTRRMANCKKP